MKREIILLACAIVFLGAGVFLFLLEDGAFESREASDEGAAVKKSRGARRPEKAARETMMGFFRVVEDEATGEFATVESSVTVPAATYTQDAETGEWITIPGTTVIEVTGTV